MWLTDAQAVLGITQRQTQYWLRRHIPSDERRWGAPALLFKDVFQLAFLAEARRQGYSIQEASKRLPELRKFVKGRLLPLITVYVLPGGMLEVTGGHRAQLAPPVVIVEGPELARKLWAHFLVRKNRPRKKRERRSPIPGAEVPAAADRAVPEGQGPDALPGEPEATPALPDKD